MLQRLVKNLLNTSEFNQKLGIVFSKVCCKRTIVVYDMNLCSENYVQLYEHLLASK